MTTKAICNPNAILLVDTEVERSQKGLARFNIAAFANDSSLGPITLGEIEELALGDTERPNIAVRCDNDSLHEAELRH